MEKAMAFLNAADVTEASKKAGVLDFSNGTFSRVKSLPPTTVQRPDRMPLESSLMCEFKAGYQAKGRKLAKNVNIWGKGFPFCS